MRILVDVRERGGIPLGVGHDKRTENGTYNETQVGEHGPNTDDPDSLAGVEGVFNATHYNSRGNGRQKATETSANRYSYQ